MTGHGVPTSRPQGSFSFYISAYRSDLILPASELADAVTIAGPKGPAAMRRVRGAGLESDVLFDGMGYAGKELPPAAEWVRTQLESGATRTLLPGVFLPWDKDDETSVSDVVAAQAALGEDIGSTMLLALDSRWLAKRSDLLMDVLRRASAPAALVLAHRADPLAAGGAVQAVRQLARSIPGLMLLRSDHGSIGALAFGAQHASVGLTTSTRHFTTAEMKARRLPGGSSRVFVRGLLDWFRAGEIAGWTAAGSETRCHLSCCRGADLGRFLDPDLDATWHNMCAIADFADFVLNADPEDRAAEFLAECRRTASLYGLAGFNGPESPKSQLTGWALS